MLSLERFELLLTNPAAFWVRRMLLWPRSRIHLDSPLTLTQNLQFQLFVANIKLDISWNLKSTRDIFTCWGVCVKPIWNQLTKREIIIDGGSTTRVGGRQTSKENGKPLPLDRSKGYIYPNPTKTYSLLTVLILDTINREDTHKPVSTESFLCYARYDGNKVTERAQVQIDKRSFARLFSG